LRVTGDIPIGDLYSYWTATPEKRNEIADRFRENGIKALVVIGPPLVTDKWAAIGNTGYYVKFLYESAARSKAVPSSK
jgi:DNA repair photolyase